MNALIIDDDPIVVTLVRAMLTSKGYNVVSVESKVNLNDLLKEGSLNLELVLLDLQIGEDSGFSIYENYFKAYMSLDKVIFMSANSERDARELYQLPDETKFLEKPFKAPDLYNLI